MYLRIASDPPGCWQVAAREAQRQNEKTFFSWQSVIFDTLVVIAAFVYQDQTYLMCR